MIFLHFFRTNAMTYLCACRFNSPLADHTDPLPTLNNTDRDSRLDTRPSFVATVSSASSKCDKECHGFCWPLVMREYLRYQYLWLHLGNWCYRVGLSYSSGHCCCRDLCCTTQRFSGFSGCMAQKFPSYNC